MSRRVLTDQLQAAGGPKEPDSYYDRVIKYIPADVVAAWTAALGLIASSSEGAQETILWIAFVVGVVFTAGWTYRQTATPGLPPAITQIVISTLAFVVWAFALGGGPFEASFDWYDPIYGSLLLIAFTLLVGLVLPRESAR